MGRGPALITGASSGIGAELARLCAADGYTPVLVARNREALERLSTELAERYRVSPRLVVADLPTGPRRKPFSTSFKARCRQSSSTTRALAYTELSARPIGPPRPI